MDRSEIERDIVATLGQIPDFFKPMPDDTLEQEWTSWKSFQLNDSALTAREKHTIGYAVAAATHCPYCTYFHRSAALMLGATDQQLEEAARFAGDTQKYSTYLHGLQIDIDAFRRQADEIRTYLSEQAEKAEQAAA
jgi:AhpD family alkylhydroperoxidase